MIEEILKAMGKGLKALAEQGNEFPSDYELLISSLENKESEEE
jgi:hypothetical protein